MGSRGRKIFLPIFLFLRLIKKITLKRWFFNKLTCIFDGVYIYF